MVGGKRPAPGGGRGPAANKKARSRSEDPMEIDNDASRSQIQLEPRPAPSILPPPRPAWQDRTVLETQFIEAWNRFEDLELQRLIVSRYIEANPSGRPTMDQVRDMVVNILRLVGARLSARDAIVLLLQAGLNAALAVQQYIRTRHPRAVVEAQEARNPPAPEVIAKEKADRIQAEDDKQPVPEDVDVVEVVSSGEGKVRAVYHHQIRKYLIQRDLKKYGSYRYKRTHGSVFEDQTAPHPDQLRWRFDKRELLPDILFQYRKDGRVVPAYTVPDMYWRGCLVIDTDRNAVLDFRHVPSTLASNAEGGLLEALERLDSRLRHQDLAARHYVPNPIALPTLRDLKNRDNKLAQQMRRWREEWCCISWATRRSGSDAFLNFMEDILPQELKDKNTTRGFRKLAPHEIAKMKDINLGKFSNRSRYPSHHEKREAYQAGLAKKRKRIRQIAEDTRVQEHLPNTHAENETSTEEEDTASETESDEDEEPQGPDSRHEVPKNEREQEELHEAMMPTIMHYLDLTGELPLITNWGIPYIVLHYNIWTQLRRTLGVEEGREPPALVGYERWLGGIGAWRSAKLMFYYKEK
ncbi:MAG: hypothetical protein L6R35_004154 [Caloplaca aegaea]|nr:MAG: hypothetical protein L6R35_004154 [Caloplaca aegaea]